MQNYIAGLVNAVNI